MSILDWYEVIGITLLLGERAVGYYQKYRHSRFIESKLQLQQGLLEQTKWFNHRAQKLAAFRWHLRNRNPTSSSWPSWCRSWTDTTSSSP